MICCLLLLGAFDPPGNLVWKYMIEYRKHFLTNTPSPGWQEDDDDDVADNNGDLFVGWKDSHHWQQQLGPTCLPTPVDPDSETMPQAAKTPHKMSLLLKSNMSLWIEWLPYMF